MDDETLAQQQIQLEYEKLRQARIDVRSNIDTETVKGLQLINGGMAAGLVAMLPVLAKDPGYAPLAQFIVGAIALTALGLAAATVHNRLRRKCNLSHEGHKARDPYKRAPFRWFASEVGEWRVCTQSVIAMWLSIASFILGASCVVVGFERLENHIAARPADIPPAAATMPAPDPRIVYELREKCGRDARDWFQHFYGNGQSHGKDFSSSNYTNHYNAKLNGCFAVVSSFSTLRDEKTQQTKSSDDRHLVDISENKDVGTYFKFSDMSGSMQCSVGENRCASRGEWEATIAPYMDQ